MTTVRVSLGAAVGALVVVSPTASLSGAWTQKPGSGQVIVSASTKSAQVAPFGSGRIDDDSSFASFFWEYGLREGLTIGGTVFAEIVTDGDDGDSADVGFFARQRLWTGEDGDVASVQLGVKQEINPLLGGDFGDPGADPANEVSLRLLYGRGWGFDWGSAFVSTEGGYHLQTDGDEDEVRLDITVGAQPDPCCMGLLSLFTTVPVGDEDVAVKLAPSFAYSFRGEDGEIEKPFTLQVGLSQDLNDFDDGLGVQVSIWKPF